MADMGVDLFPEIAKSKSGAPSRRVAPPPAQNATPSRSPSPPPRRSAPPPPPSASKSKLPAAPRVRSTPPPPPSSKGLASKSNALPPPRSSAVAASAPPLPRAEETEISVDVDLSVGVGEDTPTQLAASPLDSELDDENTPTRMQMPKDLALAKGRSVPEPARPKLDNRESDDDDDVDEPTRLVTKNQLAALPHMAKPPSRPTPPPPTKAPPSAPAKLSAPPPRFASAPPRPQSVPPPPPAGSRSPSPPPSPLASRPQAPLPPLAPRPPSAAPPAIAQRPAAPVAPRPLPRLEAPIPPSMSTPAPALPATSSPVPLPAIATPLRSTPTPRTRPRLDTLPRSQPASYPPVAVGSFSPSPFSRRPARKNAIGAALVLLAACAGAGAVFMSQDKPGTLIVTVSGPGNESVEGVAVIADDVARCESAPCRVEDLAAGTHFVKVSAKGYPATAARAVAVHGGADNAIHIELSRPVAPAAQTTSASVETPRSERKNPPDTRTVSLSDLAPQAQQSAEAPVRAAPAPRRVAARDAAKTAAPAAPASPAATPKPAAVTNGTLNLNSIPPATVVVDGRPVGPTPVVGLSVSPGAHTIVFVHPEKGRSVKMATVEAGETSAVVARF